jgi:two-component system, OmpR family, response regulator RegX3
VTTVQSTREWKVLVIEDEPSFADALTIGLQREGFRVAVAVDGQSALDRFEHLAPDIVLLDVMLPGISGLDVCRELRIRSQVPIIMVTAKSSEVDAVVGLELGADDYVAKPYRLRELVARIRAQLRRNDFRAEHPELARRIDAGDVVIDVERHEVIVRGEKTGMPLREFELLALLAASPGRVLTREHLISRLWGADYVGDTKTLDTHIKRLRAKVEEDPQNPVRIVTIRGLGYKYEARVG